MLIYKEHNDRYKTDSQLLWEYIVSIDKVKEYIKWKDQKVKETIVILG